MTEAEFIEIIHSQQKHIAFLENTISNLNANIEQLLGEISELKEALNKNSTNSSKPPSSDGLARPKTRSLRQKSGKKPGGQKGHKGVTIKVPEKADIVIEHYPEECSHCHLFGKCKGKFCRQQASRYVTDIKIAKEVTEHITMIDRLESRKESVLLFTPSCDIPFSNNAAEQTVRNLKVKTKIAGCFRSEAGAKAYLRLRSYIDSARKHGFDACQAIRLAFEGSPCLCLGC